MTNMERLDKAVKKECVRLGLQFTETQVPVTDSEGNEIKDKDGKVITRTVHTLSSISDEARELMQVFNMSQPCWFKGCEELRQQYKAEKEASGCKTCQGAIMRKYMALAKAMIKADPDRKIPKLN